MPGQDLEVFLKNKTLPGMANEAHKLELACSLKALQTADGKNRAVFKRDGTIPDGELAFLPSPAVGPADSTKICDGNLTVGGNAIAVTAFRLPAAEP